MAYLSLKRINFYLLQLMTS